MNFFFTGGAVKNNLPATAIGDRHDIADNLAPIALGIRVEGTPYLNETVAN
jgi:hypothetical protein